jgi:predicted anti-sigma-YlaC factor YlaD
MDWKLSSSRERAGDLRLTLGDHGGWPKAPSGRGNFSGTSMHYYYMDCDTIRVAISTQIDGEAPWLPADALATHLEGCPACRDWQRRAHSVTRRVRLGGAFLDHDLTPGVLAAVPVARDRRPLRLARRGLLIALALAQLAIAAPMLFLGHDREAGVHAAHELGSFNLALAIAFAIGAVRPKLSAGLAWPCGIAAGGLVTTAIIDLIGGQAIGADEAQHLVALAGAALLVWQSRERDTASAAPAVVPGEGPAVTPAGGGEVAAVERLDGAPDHPWGGDAARITAPAVAAQAVSRPFSGAKTTTSHSPVSDPPGHPSDGSPHDDRGLAEQRGARRDGQPDDRDAAHDEAVA